MIRVQPTGDFQDDSKFRFRDSSVFDELMPLRVTPLALMLDKR